MIEQLPSDLLSTHLHGRSNDDDGNSSSIYDLQNRQIIINEIKQALSGKDKGSTNIQNDFDKLSGLCELSIKEEDSLIKKSHLADLALCYIDHLKTNLKMLDEETMIDEESQLALYNVA